MKREFALRDLVLAVLGVTAMLWITPLKTESSAQMYSRPGMREHLMTGQRDDQQSKCDDRYQYEKDGKCVDKPGTTHTNHHVEPPDGQQCWDVCSCEDSQRPGVDSCSPCSYSETVCTPL